MELNYICKGTIDMRPRQWNGHIHILNDSNPYELEVTTRHSSFHILCGKHEYGNYVCIPNWNIGTELSGLSDVFWNSERLITYYPELSPVDVTSITYALVRLNEYISIKGEAG
ncbi:MAG: hypothetical protein RR621_07550 [Lachnospiraceae bacterium]